MTAPTPAIPGFTDGVLFGATALNALGSNLTNLFTYEQGGFRTRKPACALRVTSGSVASGTATIVSFGAEDVDTDNMWTSGSPSIVTAQTAGVYYCRWQFTHLGGYSTCSCYILRNSTTVSSGAIAGCSMDSSQLSCGVLVPLNSGDVLRAVAQQTTGSSQSYATTFGGCRFFAVWVAPLGNS